MYVHVVVYSGYISFKIYFLQNFIPNEVGVSRSNVYLELVQKTDHNCQRNHLYQILMGYFHQEFIISTNNEGKMHVHVCVISHAF